MDPEPITVTGNVLGNYGFLISDKHILPLDVLSELTNHLNNISESKDDLYEQ